MQTLTRVLCLSRRELVVLLLVFAASLPAVTARLYSSDEVQYFSYLRSLWFDHDVSFENEYRYFYDHNIARSAGFHETYLERQTATGLRKNYGTIGVCAPVGAVLRDRGRGGADDARGGAGRGGGRVLEAVRRRRRVRIRRARVRGDSPLDCGGAAAHRAPRGDCGRDCRLGRHASPLLHVRRAPVRPRVLGVRGGAVRHGVAARPAGMARIRSRRARPVRSAHGDGARAGHLLPRGAGRGLRPDGHSRTDETGDSREDSWLPASPGVRRSPSAGRRSFWRTPSSTAGRPRRPTSSGR